MDSVMIQKAQVQVRVNSFVRSVYNWMAIGLGITGVVAYGVANSPGVREIVFGAPLVFFGLIIAQLVMVFMISAASSACRPQPPPCCSSCIQRSTAPPFLPYSWPIRSPPSPRLSLSVQRRLRPAVFTVGPRGVI